MSKLELLLIIIVFVYNVKSYEVMLYTNVNYHRTHLQLTYFVFTSITPFLVLFPHHLQSIST